eukprot:CAMPEP_0183427298 /NCGR_PEP_ID=MMETSP0370-20130417/41081_1 /TAXON_ID=268820 /ORGANISM="Peridinium aciculiferum, Strain PAER-2" /LENGTH=134 /DNA_ID=CAMNT_0025611855 /DNA_START=238 /DNA_END=642 /DNA_ORIENTATION=-
MPSRSESGVHWNKKNHISSAFLLFLLLPWTFRWTTETDKPLCSPPSYSTKSASPSKERCSSDPDKSHDAAASPAWAAACLILACLPALPSHACRSHSRSSMDLPDLSSECKRLCPTRLGMTASNSERRHVLRGD